VWNIFGDFGGLLIWLLTSKRLELSVVGLDRNNGEEEGIVLPTSVVETRVLLSTKIQHEEMARKKEVKIENQIGNVVWIEDQEEVPNPFPSTSVF
jgi:hypothetical protein